MNELTNGTLTLEPDFIGLQQISIDLGTTQRLLFKSARTQTQSLILTLVGEGNLEADIEISSDSKISILWWNQGNVTMTETYHVKENAHLTLAYGDLNNEVLHRTSEVLLEGFGAEADIRSAAIVSTLKEVCLQLRHVHSDTTGHMENYAVMLDQGNLKLDAIGRIEKLAPRSKTHQVSRILNLAEQQKATVFPKLYIDNNDVEASHAQSIGQIDEDQLYYLQARGLDRNEAMQLIVYGYLYPIAAVIEEESVREYFINQIHEKVIDTCLM